MYYIALLLESINTNWKISAVLLVIITLVLFGLTYAITICLDPDYNDNFKDEIVKEAELQKNVFNLYYRII